MRIAYADPPYPGQARKRYGTKEVDHRQLLKQLKAFDGWALSTSAKGLRTVLPLCPPEARVASWTKQQHANPQTRGIHNVWEAVIVKPARNLRPGVPDSLMAANARGGGEHLIGRKPITFSAWLFGLLGMQAGDSLVDMYPGTGAVARAWAELGRPPEPPRRRRRRRRPQSGGQKHTPVELPEAPAEPAPPPPPAALDEMN